MKIKNHNGVSVAMLDSEDRVNNVDDLLDTMANARYNGCDSLIISKEILDSSFFDLKSGFAGEVLQKFSNYNMKIAIIGDFTQYKSKSLQDFIYECNRGNRVFFKSNVKEGLDALSPGGPE